MEEGKGREGKRGKRKRRRKEEKGDDPRTCEAYLGI